MLENSSHIVPITSSGFPVSNSASDDRSRSRPMCTKPHGVWVNFAVDDFIYVSRKIDCREQRIFNADGWSFPSTVIALIQKIMLPSDDCGQVINPHFFAKCHSIKSLAYCMLQSSITEIMLAVSEWGEEDWTELDFHNALGEMLLFDLQEPIMNLKVPLAEWSVDIIWDQDDGMLQWSEVNTAIEVNRTTKDAEWVRSHDLVFAHRWGKKVVHYEGQHV